ncbi:unnamed protein product [Dibothriocephalus latus]|uniref:Uncharacterized protein n=1 Tax=Dibothriocephalus latus TaxID=60516 RepID=A0A3P7NTU4_DIBLA|nr:unnamed protein product [Dibothriocephalus latus]
MTSPLTSNPMAMPCVNSGVCRRPDCTRECETTSLSPLPPSQSPSLPYR